MRTADIIAAVWLGAWSVVTFGAFGWDKWRAGRAGNRTAEFTLVMLGAVGGWFGGLLGMMVFRHKTAKWTFQLKYALGLVPFAGLVYAWWHWR